MFKTGRKPYQMATTESHWGNRTTEKVPLGIEVKKVETDCFSANYNEGVIGGDAHPASKRTFSVTPLHEHVSGGVRFNVEDVKAITSDMAMALTPASDRETAVERELQAFYSEDGDDLFYGLKKEEVKGIKVEVRSAQPSDLVYAGSDGFLRACLFSFARHLPLAISPDHIWTLITYAFSKHVEKHAEELRKHFVQHEGKKRIEIRVDELRLGASSPADWEALVFPKFSEEIKKHVGGGVHGNIVGGFSTTDATARACGEISLMATAKHYFSFGMRTCCGIPSVMLLGMEEDWAELRTKAEALSKLMTPEFAAMWMPSLLPILDEFVSSYKGEVNHGFWQSMVKLRHTGGGSGSYNFISGWVQNLYPYLGSGRVNPDIRPWQHAFFSGPEYDSFPCILSSAPVDWDYFGTTYNIHFHAGFSGFTQHRGGSEEDGLLPGTVMPALGWVVSHDPPKEAKDRIAEIDQEVADLVAGHLPDFLPIYERLKKKQRASSRLPEFDKSAEGGTIRTISYAMQIVKAREKEASTSEINVEALELFLDASSAPGVVPSHTAEWVRRLARLALERKGLVDSCC